MDAFTFGLVIKSLYYYNPTKTNHKAEASFLLAEDENCELILSIIMYKWRLTFHLFHFSHLFYFVIPIENLNLVIFICSKNLYKNTMQNRMGKKIPNGSTNVYSYTAWVVYDWTESSKHQNITWIKKLKAES